MAHQWTSRQSLVAALPIHVSVASTLGYAHVFRELFPRSLPRLGGLSRWAALVMPRFRTTEGSFWHGVRSCAAITGFADSQAATLDV